MGKEVKVFIGSDHAGFEYKQKIIKFLGKSGYLVKDMGPYEYDPKDDYPIYSFSVAKEVAKNKNSFGIIIARTGIGEAVAANKVKGVRAVSFLGKVNKKFIEMSRIHDNANVLAFGSDFVHFKDAKRALYIWLNTKFLGGKRHLRRLGEIEEFEKKNWKGKK